MAFGWYNTVAEADDYFLNERLITDCWDDLDVLASGSVMKEKILVNSYNRLFYDPDYSLPTLLTATAAELVVLRKAQAEEAYYLCVHLADEDRRKGIQAQGVIKAGIVQEDYYADWLAKLPIPPFVIALLYPWSVAANLRPLYAANLERVENEPDVNTDVHDEGTYLYGLKKPY